MDLFWLPYENERGMAATREALDRLRPGMKVGILIGPEGGFDDKEVALAKEAGAAVISLGSRILRCETAPLCGLSAVMYAVGEF